MYSYNSYLYIITSYIYAYIYIYRERERYVTCIYSRSCCTVGASIFSWWRSHRGCKVWVGVKVKVEVIVKLEVEVDVVRHQIECSMWYTLFTPYTVQLLSYCRFADHCLMRNSKA